MKTLHNPNLLNTYIKKNKINSLIDSRLNQYMQLILFDKNDYLYHQDEKLEHLYFFVKGKIKVCYSLSNGKENILRFLEKPRIAGEIEFILDRPAATTLQAMEPTYCITLPLKHCGHLLLKDPLFLRTISYNMAEALFAVNNNASVNQSFSPKSRIASYILSVENDSHFGIDLKNLPNVIGISDRHLFRIISELVQSNVIQKEKHGYSILDYDEMEAIAGDLYLL